MIPVKLASKNVYTNLILALAQVLAFALLLLFWPGSVSLDEQASQQSNVTTQNRGGLGGLGWEGLEGGCGRPNRGSFCGSKFASIFDPQNPCGWKCLVRFGRVSRKLKRSNFCRCRDGLHVNEPWRSPSRI